MRKRARLIFDCAVRYHLDTVFWIAAAIGGGMIGFGIPYGWIVAIGFGAVATLIVALGDKPVDPAINMNERIAAELVDQLPLQRRAGEPLPPWIEEPGAGPYHVIWRMGAEGYLRDEFFPFFSRLDKDQQEEYFARYDLGDEWPDRESWRNNLFYSGDDTP